MSKPQLEDGFTRISNEIIEALADIRISGEEMQCLWVVFRKTYGWGKREDNIYLGQFALMTKIDKPHIIRALKKLGNKNIIVAKKGNGGGKKYRLQKDTSKWQPLPKMATVAKKGNASLPKKATDTSINYPKETTTKENYCDLAKLWNETVTGNLPKIRWPDKLVTGRKTAIKKAWKDYNDLGDWEQIFKALSDSPHHQGKNERRWVADFDWIIKPANYPRFYDMSTAPKAQENMCHSPPAGEKPIATDVGAHEPKQKTPEEEQAFKKMQQKAFSRDDDTIIKQYYKGMKACENNEELHGWWDTKGLELANKMPPEDRSKAIKAKDALKYKLQYQK